MGRPPEYAEASLLLPRPLVAFARAVHGGEIIEQLSMPSGSNPSKVIFIALIGNLAVAISKFIAAAITGSAALPAEAFHSCATENSGCPAL